MAPKRICGELLTIVLPVLASMSIGACGDDSDSSTNADAASGGAKHDASSSKDTGTGTGGAATTGGTGGGGAGDAATNGPDGSGDGSAGVDGSDGGSAIVGCDPAWVYCDDFESYALGDPPNGKQIGEAGGLMSVDSTHAVSGSQSLKVVTGPGQVAGISLDPSLFPIGNNDIYGRMMMWWETVPPDGNAWTFARVWGSGDRYYLFGGQNGKFLDIYYPGDCPSGVGPEIPTGKWICVQWQADGSPDGAGGTKDEARMWLDGVETTDMTVIKQNKCASWEAPTWTGIILGRSYGDSVVYFDDWAVDSKPIPCPTSNL
jgi:hypothetical protein